MISMPTPPSESLLLFNPWNQLNFYVTGFKNTQASRDNRNCHFHAQLCRCTEFAAPALSQASSRRLNDAFNFLSFLRGSVFSRLFLHTTIVCVQRQDTRHRTVYREMNSLVVKVSNLVQFQPDLSTFARVVLNSSRAVCI